MPNNKAYLGNPFRMHTLCVTRAAAKSRRVRALRGQSTNQNLRVSAVVEIALARAPEPRPCHEPSPGLTQFIFIAMRTLQTRLRCC